MKERGQIKKLFFAGGGTGGHIYPAAAVAEQIRKQKADTEILFFCSSRAIDSHILAAEGFEFIPISAVGFSAHPLKLAFFAAGLVKSYYFAKQILAANREGAAVAATGGFVSVPVVMAARSLEIPVVLINVDSVPGRANKLIASRAEKIFVQFEGTGQYFGRQKSKVEVVGCPLREGFCRPDREKVISELGLDVNKKTLVITGASSGAQNINRAVEEILPRLAGLAEGWQVVHLTGRANIEDVRRNVSAGGISYKPVDYYDDMGSLLAAAELVAGRAGAVSVAEYAAAGRPAVCIPYPYHKDRHQYLNAKYLVEAGAAVIVEDQKENTAATAEKLYQRLAELMVDDEKRKRMSKAGRVCSKPDAAEKIARALLA